MNSLVNGLSQVYLEKLRRYLAREEEAVLQEAYELGRAALARGLGIMDMAKIHQAAWGRLLMAPKAVSRNGKAFNGAETFFLETLSPFEATHRGFRETNVRLRLLIENLRESEEHYRQLFKEAQSMQEGLRDLSSQLLRIQEEERKQISRELHDEVGQALTAINVNLAVLKKEVAAANPTFERRIADTQNLLEQTMTTVHRFARELRPAMLDDLGLVPALRSYIDQFTERTGIQIAFAAAPGVERLDNERKTVVYRVVQESLTNVAKHAHATRVEVTIQLTPRGIALAVRDNGQAFEVDAALALKKKNRLGLLGMRERVRLVNGVLAIESVPGKGTTVRAELPWQARKSTVTHRYQAR